MHTDDLLRRYHREFAGSTARGYEGARGEDGRNSYDILADLVPRISAPLTLLDLACGDGPLLQRLHQRQQPGLRLIGIDMSAEELALARTRLGAADADLRLEQAQSLSLADASIDVVLSHMALMLMNPIEPVIAEIARVLKPGGLFAAVVNTDDPPDGVWKAFRDAARAILKQEGTPAVRIGDQRTYNEFGLRDLFGADSTFEQPITLSSVMLRIDGRAEAVTESLSRTYYQVMLSERGLAELAQRTNEILKEFADGDGVIPLRMPLRLVLVKRRTR